MVVLKWHAVSVRGELTAVLGYGAIRLKKHLRVTENFTIDFSGMTKSCYNCNAYGIIARLVGVLGEGV